MILFLLISSLGLNAYLMVTLTFLRKDFAVVQRSLFELSEEKFEQIPLPKPPKIMIFERDRLDHFQTIEEWIDFQGGETH